MTNWRPKSRFRIGAMRSRITIQRATTDDSSGQPDRTWATHIADEPVLYDPAAGSETVRGRQVEANVKSVFVMHFNDDVTVEDCVHFEGAIYGIVAIVPVEGGRRYMELHCRGES